MKKYILTAVSIFLLLTIPSISAIEYQEVAKEYESITEQKLDSLAIMIESKRNEIADTLEQQGFNEESDGFLKEKVTEILKNKGPLVTRLIDLIKADGNFSSFDLIMALIGTLIFFILTQPIFLQLIVEAGNDVIFIILILSLIVIEVGQKFFALKVIGVWEEYIAEDIDGFWNFFSIVFFSIYFKIYLSYLPTFIIQYSTVLVKAAFYILMFAIPILFNFFIADSMDLIDWNGDEYPPLANIS